MWEIMDQLPLAHVPTGHRPHSPALCPDQKSNERTFALGDNT